MNKNEEYFKDNKDKYAIIKDNTVVGVFATEEEAYAAALESYHPGEFFISHCKEGESINVPKKQLTPKSEYASVSGVLTWAFAIIGGFFHVYSSSAKVAGDFIAADNRFVLAILCYVLSGICFWVWLIGKINKANDNAKIAHDKIAKLQKQIEALKKEKDLNE